MNFARVRLSQPVPAEATSLPPVAMVADRLAEHDYVRVLLKIEELNAPRLAAMEGL